VKKSVKFVSIGRITLGIKARTEGYRVALVRARPSARQTKEAGRTAAAKALRRNASCVICDQAGLDQLIGRLRLKEELT